MKNKNDIPLSLLETAEWSGEGFKPVLEIGGYRLAVLRYFSGVSRDNIVRIERHIDTDEIFILTDGNAQMIILESAGENSGVHVFPMKKNSLYNVKKGTWHHVLLSRDANIIIFERADTSRENSEYFKPGAELVKIILDRISVF